eukprot:CAMPEP_0172376886 /NCGR_PEP_ID=MMETSP1060-20121228/68618_1 /TAXON_ID=37318 /ORGANISM="Pseudo-nitzschia pungens, Strain cf. cingulata" /LENGTH=76 /DNA_ID=CAMNT_0013104551 /DNA_START=90 /DNA_END=317 /DNA_ORIENTATION=-
MAADVKREVMNRNPTEHVAPLDDSDSGNLATATTCSVRRWMNADSKKPGTEAFYFAVLLSRAICPTRGRTPIQEPW